MSHFAVLVIGENPEEQLKPFDENIQVAPYVRYTKEELIRNGREEIENYKNGTYAKFLADPEKYREEAKGNPGHLKYVEFEFPKKLSWTDEQIYQDEIKHLEPEDIDMNGGEISTYNPKSKWDWYQIGGRYAGRLFLKEGIEATDIPNFSWGWSEQRQRETLSEPRVDQALMKDIDWQKIHLTKKEYDEAARFWEMRVNGDEPQTEDEKESMKYDWYKTEYYTNRYKDKDTYAKCMSSFTMWAVLKDGEWYEKREMGWWGLSGESNEEAVKWELGFYDHFIKDLPPDTLLTVVDCHI